MRALDDKAQLAYVLNQMAILYLGTGDIKKARVAGREAFAAAEAVNRITEIVVARSILDRTSTVVGNKHESNREEQTVKENVVDPVFLSARAKFHLASAQVRFEIPTEAQTVAP